MTKKIPYKDSRMCHKLTEYDIPLVCSSMIPVHLDPAIIEAMYPVYPRWEKKLLKRKYGTRQAVYLDVWKHTKPSLFDLILKVKIDGD